MDTFCYERQTRGLDGGRLVRPPPDLPPPRRHPVERGVRTVGHRAAVHRRRLRPADGRGHRPDGDARRRRDQVRDQRPAVAHARRDARARRDDRGAQPVVGRRGVGQGRPRHRPAGGGVDDVRLPEAVRPALVGHLALLPVRAHRAPHLRPLRRALQQDLRHRAPARAVGEPARHAPQPVLRAGGGARRGVLRCPRLGAAAVVRVEHRSGSPLPRPLRAASARVGRPVVVADHQRRAPLHARPRRHGRPDRVQRVRLRGAGHARLPAVHVREQRRRAGRPLRLHAVAHAARRLPWRPDDHAARRPALPRDHRRVRRWPGQVLVHAPHADRRIGHVHRQHVRNVHDRRVGSRCRSDDGEDRHRAVEAVRRVAGRIPLRRGARGPDRRRAVHDVPHLLRRRERLGDLHQHRARPARLGLDLGGRRGVRHPPHRHRRVRRDGTDREGLPADGRRARERVQPGRGRAGAAEGEVGRLHRQGRLPRRPGRRARHDPVHAGDARPHQRRRHAALPDRRQRADPHARRRAHRRRPRPRVAGDHGRRRAVARLVPAARLPPARARGRGQRVAGDVHERAVPRARRSASAASRCSIPTTRG